MSGWSEDADIAAQVDEANEARRDEIATQRAQDAHLIYDERRPERWAEEA
jgi:hypothetical protein